MMHIVSSGIKIISFFVVVCAVIIHVASIILWVGSRGRYGALYPTYVPRSIAALVFLSITIVCFAQLLVPEQLAAAVQVCSYATDWFAYVRLFVVAYFVGAVPVGWLVARWQGVEDIRQHGSGNIGATNVSRVLGKKWFFVVWVIDVAKAWFVAHTIVAWHACSPIALPALMLLFLGNLYSVFLGFSGGKGISTALGIMSAISPFIALLQLVVWAVVLKITGTIGIASVAAAASLPLSAYYLLADFHYVFLLSFMSFCILIKHRSNIQQYLHKHLAH